MKFQLITFLGTLITTSSIIAVNATGPPSHVQPPPQAKGRYKTFSEQTNGETSSVELYEDGPSLQCTMNAIRSGGKSNARYCQSGLTTMTVVDVECPRQGLFDNNPSSSPQGKKNCFAASIVDGANGKIYHVNSAGEVNERSSSDYPEEEHLEDGEEPADDGVVVVDTDNGNVSSDDIRRSLLRGSDKSVRGEERDLQVTTPVIDVMVSLINV